VTAVGHCNGHTIVFLNDEWRWFDTLGLVTDESTMLHPCPRCGKPPTPEGYDACLGHIPGAGGACCGHGIEEGRVCFDDGRIETLPILPVVAAVREEERGP